MIPMLHLFLAQKETKRNETRAPVLHLFLTQTGAERNEMCAVSPGAMERIQQHDCCNQHENTENPIKRNSYGHLFISIVNDARFTELG